MQVHVGMATSRRCSMLSVKLPNLVAPKSLWSKSIISMSTRASPVCGVAHLASASLIPMTLNVFYGLSTRATHLSSALLAIGATFLVSSNFFSTVWSTVLWPKLITHIQSLCRKAKNVYFSAPRLHHGLSISFSTRAMAPYVQ